MPLMSFAIDIGPAQGQRKTERGTCVCVYYTWQCVRVYCVRLCVCLCVYEMYESCKKLLIAKGLRLEQAIGSSRFLAWQHREAVSGDKGAKLGTLFNL
jgi:hypothetical protein